MAYHFNTLITGVASIEDLKSKISASGSLNYKEDDHHIIIFSINNQRTGVELDDSTKSVIIEKSTMTPIASQFNKLIYNEDAKEFLNGKNWSDVSVKYCFEGTMIVVFFSHDNWYVCTRKCLDARKSFWIKDISYYDLFMEAIDGKFALDDLNKDYCYHFILIHHKNKNIVDYSRLGKQYKTVSLAMTTEKTTLKRIHYRINDKIIYPRVVNFNSLDEVVKELSDISDGDRHTQQISTEGFIIEYFENNVLTLLKLQTPIYKFIADAKPNVSNLEAMFLELYQHDKLGDIIPFFSAQCGETVLRIKNAMYTISNELLNIYHCTRNRKNELLYSVLPQSYRTAIYIIHGDYLQKRAKELAKMENPTDMKGDKKSMTVHDVYLCLKKLDGYVLRKIFVDRLTLKENEAFKHMFNHGCYDALLQGRLLA